MFQKSLTDKRRVIIVDVTHLFYKYQYGTGGMNLSTTIIAHNLYDKTNSSVNINLYFSSSRINYRYHKQLKIFQINK